MVNLGIDIGGTKIRAVLVSKKKIIRSYEYRTPQTRSQFQETLGQILKRTRVRGKVGVGVPGVIRGSLIRSCPNIRYLKNVSLAKILHYKAEFILDNDARCFARAESMFGMGEKNKNFFVLTLGTGIGRAVVLDRKVKVIKNFEYPELWEKEYQRIRSKDPRKLVIFLAAKIALLVKAYNISALVIGGGALGHNGLFLELKKELSKSLKLPVMRFRFRLNSGALGAALLK